MNIWWILGAPAWFIIVITAIARLNDIKKTQNSIRWHCRRLSMLGSFVVGNVALALPFTANTSWGPSINWLTTLAGWSWALAWLTTPNMPPWHRWALGLHRVWTPERPRPAFVGRITNEFRALGESFIHTTDVPMIYTDDDEDVPGERREPDAVERRSGVSRRLYNKEDRRSGKDRRETKAPPSTM